MMRFCILYNANRAKYRADNRAFQDVAGWKTKKIARHFHRMYTAKEFTTKGISVSKTIFQTGRRHHHQSMTIDFIYMIKFILCQFYAY